MANIRDTLSHTKWLCKYHIVFTPKYRRKAIYGQYKESVGKILRQLCSYKGVEIIEGHLMPDHIHMLVSIAPKYSVSQFMGYLKGKSSLMIFDKHANLKYKFGNRHFWSEGYYVSTVGLNEATIRKYIAEQEAHDIARINLRQKNTKTLSRVVSSTNAPSGAATSQSAIDLNVSESRDLSLSLGTEPYRLCSNHPFDGWFVICFCREIFFST